MDDVDVSLLTDAQRAELATWEEFFNHPGWALLLQHFQPMQENLLPMFRNCATEGALGYTRGYADTLENICSLDRVIALQFRLQAKNAAASAETADEDDE